MLHVRCPHCAKRSRVSRWVAHLFRGGETDDPRTRSRGRIAYERCQRPDTTRVNELPHDTPVAPVVGQVEVRDLPQRHASCKDGWPIASEVGESDRYKRARELRGRSRASTVPYPCRPCRATCCTYDACVARSGVESNGRVAHRFSGWVPHLFRGGGPDDLLIFRALAEGKPNAVNLR